MAGPCDSDAEDDWLVYNNDIEAMRSVEYPMLKDAVYLDHAGTTLYSKTLIESFSANMLSNLYGNPHSGSASSVLATRNVENIRHNVLQFLGVDPVFFDLVFVANATAGAKLVAEAFRDHDSGFWYGYHKDSHTSLVGIRELASQGHRCFKSDAEVDDWLCASDQKNISQLQLFAYPAQSNMDGRLLPQHWPRLAQGNTENHRRKRHVLLDAAAFASTTTLDFVNEQEAPDFTILSFNKLFGFPDLGGLIVKKSSASILNRRKYFGGGTVDMVLCLDEQWHARKNAAVHESLEDGTLPIHSIMALQSAMDAHQKCFKSMQNVSRHTKTLASRLSTKLRALHHGNGRPVCAMYREEVAGPIVSFNIKTASQAWINNIEIEKLAAIHSFHVRSGGLCNPGGIASTLAIESWEMRANFSAGRRCGDDDARVTQKPSGMIRLSLGAMSTMSDVDKFVDFVKDFFATDEEPVEPSSEQPPPQITDLFVESLTIYPIKSCAGWTLPQSVDWPVRSEGLAWDREWCIVHRGSGTCLNQKKYPRMALLRPEIDTQMGVLRLTYRGILGAEFGLPRTIEVPLSADPRLFEENDMAQCGSMICADKVTVQRYKSSAITAFLSTVLEVPCDLARFPSSSAIASQRHAKDYPLPLLCSNESPILTVFRPSLDRLNEQIKARGAKAVGVESFRANIVVATTLAPSMQADQAYADDHWALVKIGSEHFQMLGPCRRCQMVCIDQETAERRVEPFATLAKTRRARGKVWFGQHTCHLSSSRGDTSASREVTIRVGDSVTAICKGLEAEQVLGSAGQHSPGPMYS